MASRRSASSSKPPSSSSSSGVNCGHFQLLDFQHLENGRDHLAAEVEIRGVGRDFGVGRAGFAGADAGHQFVEILDLAVAETQYRPEADDFFVALEMTCSPSLKVRFTVT